MIKMTVDEVRNLIFGAEDSIVSIFGLLIGITTVSGFSTEQILTTGFVTIAVEATSMGAGAFLSEESSNELEGRSRHNTRVNAVVMFLSFLIAGFIPLAPYALLPVDNARILSALFSFTALFILGYLPKKKAKSGLRMALIAGLAAAIGYLVAHVFSV